MNQRGSVETGGQNDLFAGAARKTFFNDNAIKFGDPTRLKVGEWVRVKDTAPVLRGRHGEVVRHGQDPSDVMVRF